MNSNKGLVLSTIELLNLLRNNSPELIRVTIRQLAEWGDNSKIIGKSNNALGQKLKIDRGVTHDLDMNTSDRFCVVCGQHFTNTELLMEHIKTHTEFVCTTCKVQVGRYEQLVCHSVTFCRSPLWNLKCLYCHNTKKDCQCWKATEQFLENMLRFVQAKSKNNIFSSDMISTISHYYNTKSVFKIRESIEDTYKCLLDGASEQQPLVLDIESNVKLLNEKLELMLPVVVKDHSKIICQVLGINTEWKNIKSVLEPYFASYQDAELQILKRLKGL